MRERARSCGTTSTQWTLWATVFRSLRDLFCCSLLLSQAGCATFAVELTGQAAYVIDGDSLILVQENGDRERIRLYAIDCPELTQRFGPEARQATTEWTRDAVVTVKAWGIDFYTGQVTGMVILPNGKNLNYELVKAGLAWWDRDYPEERELAELEAQARSAGDGLWGDPDPIPPWEFRKLPKGRAPSAG